MIRRAIVAIAMIATLFALAMASAKADEKKQRQVASAQTTKQVVKSSKTKQVSTCFDRGFGCETSQFGW